MEALNKIFRRFKSQHKISPAVATSKTFNKGFRIIHSYSDGNKRHYPSSPNGSDIHNSDNTSAAASPAVGMTTKRLRFHDVKRKVHSIQPKLVSMYDIVEDCDRLKEERFKRNYIGKLLKSNIFRVLIMVVIILNSIVITVQTDKYLETKFGTLFTILDKIFLLVFVIKILLKWYYDFYTFWRVGWNVFDFIIVIASLLGPDLAITSNSATVHRVLGVFRALRVLLSISALQGLQVIVHTIIHSIPDMANIVALLLITMYIFAVMFVSFFGESCPKYFGTFGKALFSLFICVTQDGWIKIRDDLKACGQDIAGSILLTMFIMIGAFVFANLVVAVVVINLEWSMSVQKELQKKFRKLKNENTVSNITLRTVDASAILKLMVHNQEPLLIPNVTPRINSLEVYCLIVAQIEENLAQFKEIREKIAEILTEVKVLAQLDNDEDATVWTTTSDDVNNIKVSKSSASSKQFNFDTLKLPSHQTHRKRSVISELTQHTVGIHRSSSIF